MSQAELLIAGLLVAVASLSGRARLLSLPYPIVLVIGGAVLGFVPGLPQVRLNPDVVLVVFLPPLLYASAIYANFHDFRAEARWPALNTGTRSLSERGSGSAPRGRSELGALHAARIAERFLTAVRCSAGGKAGLRVAGWSSGTSRRRRACASGGTGEADEVALGVCEVADDEAVGRRHGTHLALSAQDLRLAQSSLYVRHPDVEHDVPVVGLTTADPAADPTAIACGE